MDITRFSISSSNDKHDYKYPISGPHSNTWSGKAIEIGKTKIPFPSEPSPCDQRVFGTPSAFTQVLNMIATDPFFFRIQAPAASFFGKSPLKIVLKNPMVVKRWLKPQTRLGLETRRSFTTALLFNFRPPLRRHPPSRPNLIRPPEKRLTMSLEGKTKQPRKHSNRFLTYICKQRLVDLWGRRERTKYREKIMILTMSDKLK
ncbi:hypothetical protein V6N13_094880 [Hibiscus sabdariffa]